MLRNFVSTTREEDAVKEGFGEPGNLCVFAKFEGYFGANSLVTVWRIRCVKMVTRRCFNFRNCEESMNPLVDISVN